MNVKLIAIAALGKNREIGLKNDLPWSIPKEYEHFQETVLGQHVLIGRKNFESHDGDIDHTIPYILTRNKDYKTSTAQTVTSIKEALALAASDGADKVYVIGGAEIYQLALPYLSEFLWSEIDYQGPADAFFPEFLQYSWETLEEERHDGWTFRRLVKTPQNL